jgi:hypothetical protein
MWLVVGQHEMLDPTAVGVFGDKVETDLQSQIDS